MKKLILKSFAFAVFNAALLLFACEVAMPEPASSALYKRQIAESHLDSETLILGSSHATMGIVPRHLGGSAVNLANASQDLYYDCEIARRYIPKMPRLRRVVLEISFFSWEYGVPNGLEAWREELYYRAFGIPPRHRSWKPGYYSRIACYGVNRAGFLQREPNRFDADGWLRRTGALDTVTGKIAASRHLSALRSKETPYNLGHATSLVRECKRRGIDVVLVTTPTHECYHTQLDTKALQRMRDTTWRFCSENGVRHLDYQDDGRFTAEDFADGDHLNVAGAIKFTHILQVDLARSPAPLEARREKIGVN